MFVLMYSIKSSVLSDYVIYGNNQSPFSSNFGNDFMQTNDVTAIRALGECSLN